MLTFIVCLVINIIVFIFTLVSHNEISKEHTGLRILGICLMCWCMFWACFCLYNINQLLGITTLH